MGMQFHDCLALCGVKLKQWGGEIPKFWNMIENLKRKLHTLKGRRDINSASEYLEASVELHTLYAQEETYWKQCAKQHLLKEGDHNTKFFHRYASSKKRKNRISRLRNDESLWVEGDEMQQIIVNYFKDIFTSFGYSASAIEGLITPRIFLTNNNMLLKPFREEEIKEALFSMFPEKSPGPDRLNLGFYQFFWEEICTDLVTFCLDCLNNSSFPEGLNDAYITLIPKKKNS